MVSPQEYANKIDDLGLNKINSKINSIQDAQRLLSQLQKAINTLWELKKGIKVDISEIWDQYREGSKDTVRGALGHAFVGGVLGKRTAYQVRKVTREQRANNRDQLIAVYRKIESNIDNLLKQVNDTKRVVQAVMDELKAEERKNELKQARPYSRDTNAGIEYNEYINSPEWREKAEEAKARAGNRCQVCNRSRAEVQIDAHHRTYERLGKELIEDITVLCRECHQLYEDAKKTLPAPLPTTSESGFCIRCKTTIKLDPQAPYCYSCFKVWKKFENPNYKEQHCHFCGKENRSTRLKPACYECYKEHRDEARSHRVICGGISGDVCK